MFWFEDDARGIKAGQNDILKEVNLDKLSNNSLQIECEARGLPSKKSRKADLVRRIEKYLYPAVNSLKMI